MSKELIQIEVANKTTGGELTDLKRIKKRMGKVLIVELQSQGYTV